MKTVVQFDCVWNMSFKVKQTKEIIRALHRWTVANIDNKWSVEYVKNQNLTRQHKKRKINTGYCSKVC